MTKQEENWEMMTVLQIPWYHANRIDDREDRDFLMNKTKEIKAHFEKQQAEMLAAQQGGGGVQGGVPNIITP